MKIQLVNCRGTLYKSLLSTFILLFLLAGILNAQTIAEKKQGLHRRGGGADLDPQTQQLLEKVNNDLSIRKTELHQFYSQVAELNAQQAPPEAYKDLLDKINQVRASIQKIDENWQENAALSNRGEGYALWHQPETTLEQLVIDYGSQDFVYLMTPEIGNMKLSVASSLAIPRASWNEMLELILKQNGIGIRQLNPYLRELYFFERGYFPLLTITNQKQDLELYPREARLAFMLSPDPSKIHHSFQFLQRFVNPKTTSLQLIGRNILVVGQVGDIQDLLKLYDFVAVSQGNLEYKLIPLSKVKAEDMARILGAVFDQLIEEGEGKQSSRNLSKKTEDSADLVMEGSETNGLKIIVLEGISQALFLVGTKDEICQAGRMICDLENQFTGAREKVIHWYTVKHSNAEELAAVLEKIYSMMVEENVGPEGPPRDNMAQAPSLVDQANAPGLPRDRYNDNFYEQGDVAVDPAPVTLVPTREPKEPNEGRENFIVDIKTGAIVMVVEADILPKIQEVIKKLDVPKKMVQIEVLLFEKRVNDKNDYGLNLLRIGDKACNKDVSSFTFQDILPLHLGITEFIFSRKKDSGIPAFDLIYRFLLSQDDVQINASPSVLTINQTPAKIAIVEEFSLNTGVVEIETAKGVSLKDSYTRGQYGITMEITPTIHMRDNGECDWEDDGVNYITLETDVNFDTVHPDFSTPGRPVVTRRNIHNEVLIPDGQTVILGGLRRKNTQDTKESIPFLGEIPGIGKLFSNTTMHDCTTEMFIFITPKIVVDPCEDLERIKYEQMLKRPGDIPDFLVRLDDARIAERNRLFAQSLTILLGRKPDSFYQTHTCDEAENWCPGEYDGR